MTSSLRTLANILLSSLVVTAILFGAYWLVISPNPDLRGSLYIASVTFLFVCLAVMLAHFFSIFDTRARDKKSKGF
jgi:bacteriorhodopsin